MKMDAGVFADRSPVLSGGSSAPRFGTWMYDRLDGRIVRDDNLHRLFGLGNKPDSSDDDFFALLHPADAARVRATVRKAYETNTGYSMTYRIVLPDGSVRSISSRATIIREPGRSDIGTHGVCFDVSHLAHGNVLEKNPHSLSRHESPDSSVETTVSRRAFEAHLRAVAEFTRAIQDSGRLDGFPESKLLDRVVATSQRMTSQK